MEEKCVNSIKVTKTTSTSSHTSNVATTSPAASEEAHTRPSTSRRSSMSLLQENFSNSAQHDFAAALDEETTTSGVLETFEISSSNSNSLPTTSSETEAAVEVGGVDDSSSTDIIKLMDVTEPPTSCHNQIFNSEVFVINDDDDDDDGDDEDEDGDGDGDNDALAAHEIDDDDDEDDEDDNDDVDDEDGEVEIDHEVNDVKVGSKESAVRIATMNSSQSVVNAHHNHHHQHHNAGSSESQLGGVIVSSNVTTIYIETPVVEEQPHHSQLTANNSEHLVFTQSNVVKPKRLSEEFLLPENADGVVELEDEGSTSNDQNMEANKTTGRWDESIADAMQPDKMSFRLKRMQINNPSNLEVSANDALLRTNELPSSSHGLITGVVPSTNTIANAKTLTSGATSATLASTSIESMDLLERRDFETEQRLTGGILLKSSSLIKKNKLNLSILESCKQQQQQQQQDRSVSRCVSTEERMDCINNRSSNGARAVSSDSKCTYSKEPMTTPTSSRSSTSRLTKSTAKLNLCSTLSHPPTAEEHSQLSAAVANVGIAKIQLQTPKNLSSSTLSSSTSSSVIVEAPSTSTGAGRSNSSTPTAAAAAASELFSNSNSNDSLTSGLATSALNTRINSNCQQTQPQQQQQSPKPPPPIQQEYTHTVAELEGGCSRTSAIHTLAATAEHSGTFDDAQPSTSSARCQYAPPSKGMMRQVHASAQTYDRYLPRGESFSGSSASSDSGINLSMSNRNRRRTEPATTSNLMLRNGMNDDVVVAFKVIVSDADNVDGSLGEFNEDPWADCEENNSDLEEICTCHHSINDSSHGGSTASLNEHDELDTTANVTSSRDGDLSNYIQMVSISEESPTPAGALGDGASSTAAQQQLQRKRKYNESRLLDGDYGVTASNSGGNGIGSIGDSNSRKRIAYDCASTPRSLQNSGAFMLISTPTTQKALSASNSPIGRRTPRSLIPTRENPPPELSNWLSQFQRWSHAERLLAIDRMIEHCEPTQVRHMMKVIEPQFQRDFISLLPRELALQVLAYLDPKDLLRAAQTCRSWRFLCDDNLLWKEKCRKAQILTEPQTDRPKRGRAGNMPPIASPWKAAYMRQHIIEMNWRSRPIREPKVLKGHDDHVITCLQFSGNRIVSGSDDNTLKVWSAVTGRCLRTLVGHTGGVWSSQMSGNIIISGSTDRTLKVWDMETGQCVHTLQGHTSTVRCMHLHGNKVVSGSRDATLRVWDIDQGKCLHLLVGHLAAVRCVQYDGKLIVSGAYDYMVKIWHPERQECLHTLQGHTNRVYSLQFDGLHVVSGSLDTSIRVWDVETGNCKHTLMGHQSLTSGMELRQNILVSGNADSTVKVWDITTGQCLQTLSGPNKHQSAVTCLQFNSRFVVTSSDDGTVKLWDVKTGEFIRNLVALDSGGSGGVVWRIRANDTKLICAVGSRNGTEETKLMVLDFDVEGACVKCS